MSNADADLDALLDEALDIMDEQEREEEAKLKVQAEERAALAAAAAAKNSANSNDLTKMLESLLKTLESKSDDVEAWNEEEVKSMMGTLNSMMTSLMDGASEDEKKRISACTAMMEMVKDDKLNYPADVMEQMIREAGLAEPESGVTDTSTPEELTELVEKLMEEMKKVGEEANSLAEHCANAKAVQDANEPVAVGQVVEGASRATGTSDCGDHDDKCIAGTLALLNELK